jgi:hypothetical protein
VRSAVLCACAATDAIVKGSKRPQLGVDVQEAVPHALVQLRVELEPEDDVFHPANRGLVALCTFGLRRDGEKNCCTLDSPTDMVTQPAATAAAVRSGDRSSIHAASSTP